MDTLQRFIYTRTYSRWIEDLKRREQYPESVKRVMNFFKNELGDIISPHFYNLGEQALLDMQALCSMRAMWAAGDAAKKNHIPLYNCSYLTISSIQAFSEVLYILMCGTGVGFSVERIYIDQLPAISAKSSRQIKLVVEDSREGWAIALDSYLKAMYSGQDVMVDMTKIRPRGSRLITMGGRASGPEPLLDLFNFINNLFQTKRKRGQSKLYSIDVLDICNKIAEIVVVGGVRRSSEISLSDLEDVQVARAKVGEFWKEYPHRMMSNNSTAYNVKPDMLSFMDEFLNLIRSGSGERGIFNREGARKQLTASGRRKDNEHIGVNPCSEIILRDMEFCNLSEVVVRANDNRQSLRNKVKVAAMFGAWQAAFTKFPYLRKDWKQNCEEERLLGVSLTGIMDNPVLNNVNDRMKRWLGELKSLAIEETERWCDRLKINMSAAVTCVKPSGCRPWYSLTTTNQGIFTLEELFENHPLNFKWGELNKYNSVETNDKISKTFNNGSDFVYRINMSYGLSVDSTSNHMWQVEGKGWIQTQSIMEGDILDIKLPSYINKEHSHLLRLDSLALKMRGDADIITEPDFMSPDLSWLLGYLWGDGAMSPSKYRIRFCDERKENLKKAQQVLKTIFKLNTKIWNKDNEKALTLDCSSKMLWHWLIKNDVWKYFSDSINIIPKCIRQSSQEDICAFVAGLLDSDGWAGIPANGCKGGKFTITTASQLFAKHLQDVCWTVGLGIGCSLNDCGKNLQRNKLMYLLTGGKWMDPGAFKFLLIHSNKLQSVQKSKQFIGWHHELAKKSFMPGKVLSIENLGVMPTFDIEVENSHWYRAGAVKSHNTVSQLVNSASGIHQRYSDYYIRRYRISATDPLFRMLRDQNVPYNPEVGQEAGTASTFVLDFPVMSPKGAKTRHDFTAMQQLEHWKIVKEFWCEHNPSITVYVGEDEWLDTAAWCYRNFDDLCGVSFLPRSQHVYQLAPYEEITKQQYDKLAKSFPEINYDELSKYEQEDNTEGAKTYNCTGDRCDI